MHSLVSEETKCKRPHSPSEDVTWKQEPSALSNDMSQCGCGVCLTQHVWPRELRGLGGEGAADLRAPSPAAG